MVLKRAWHPCKLLQSRMTSMNVVVSLRTFDFSLRGTQALHRFCNRLVIHWSGEALLWDLRLVCWLVGWLPQKNMVVDQAHIRTRPDQTIAHYTRPSIITPDHTTGQTQQGKSNTNSVLSLVKSRVFLGYRILLLINR